ncbi:coumaroyl-CoA:anthocyanidin 3-O-glucoside-6''-O-coumaroyltransferase 1-like [Vicia villosa]|uniref:coumaroyl-CoA:anthocyanidin 3-O-glucoside-6''-O-coumaroyltransferase 1-like n=1 Tax=Vicia villosa TaxID=3911 RepID=UPI00273A80E2|nr:coumaroyl-CoA:anthocyanidin 3-O-glucoside-6''-O-coumaroyltransferase 1-like [Vicia villosa]
MMMKVIEESQVSPPPNSLPSPTTLPLTLFDISWFFIIPPVQRIFFYHFPHPTHHFLQTTLPILKHSLSLTLQHFFPFSSNLIILPNSDNPPYIRYLDGDSLSFTVSESSADFNLLISDSQDAQNWHPLVPNLPPPRTEPNGTTVVPLMAIQVTVLPNSGFSICLTFKHVAADGKSLHHFMKYWASLSKAIANNNNNSLSLDLPSHERDKILTFPNAPKLTYLYKDAYRSSYVDKVRTSLVLSHEQVQKLKKWFGIPRRKNWLSPPLPYCPSPFEDPSGYCLPLLDVLRYSFFCLTQPSKAHFLSPLLSYLLSPVSLSWRLRILFLGRKWFVDNCKDTTKHISTFVVTCSLVWFCMVKSEKNTGGDDFVVDDLCNFLFLADCRDRPEYSLPKTYFGNCLASYSVVVKRGELVGKDGIVVAANGIERKIRDFKSDALLGAEVLMPDYRQLWKQGMSFVVVAGSPKLGVYETDFGWGKPVKSDAVHIDLFGSISLSDCRDGGGGIEVGLALERNRMANFVSIFQEQLDSICSIQFL